MPKHMPYTRLSCFMERNGLDSRSRDSKIGNWVGGIATFFLVSFFWYLFTFQQVQFQNFLDVQIHSIMLMRTRGAIFNSMSVTGLGIINPSSVLSLGAI